MSVSNGEYIDFFYAMFENSKQDTVSSRFQTTMYLQISTENVTRKKIFLIFLFQKIDLLPLSKACCFGILQVSRHSVFDVQSNSSPTLCSKLQIISMDLPHHASNRPTPAKFENNFHSLHILTQSSLFILCSLQITSIPVSNRM